MTPNYHQKFREVLRYRQKLPVYRYKDEFLRLLDNNQCIILTGETGSGKTTQVPQWCVDYLMENGSRSKVVCTQPRRVAAVNVAKRVAFEMGVEVGRQVGYSIRFEDCTCYDTLLTFSTDGVLARELINCPDLDAYGIVIIDEAHERSISTDMLLGLTKELIDRRKDLKIVIMSATVDIHEFSRYLNGCPFLEIPGRFFPVDLFYYEESVYEYTALVPRIVQYIHQNEEKGDILVFLTGEEEIEMVCRQLYLTISTDLQVYPLYSALSNEDQQRVFEPLTSNVDGAYPARKCIVSTNIAETSVTIDGVRYVVDAGYRKQKCFVPETQSYVFEVARISKASANQRKGRAGRTTPGICYRLYAEEEYENMADHTPPEILLCNLASLVLLFKRLGINPRTFDFMTKPNSESFDQAFELLRNLGALDEADGLTLDGQMLAEFPLDPQQAKMLIQSARKYECSDQILSLVAMLSSPRVFVRPQARKTKAILCHARFASSSGDHLALINVFEAFQNTKQGRKGWCADNFLRYQSLTSAANARRQLVRIMERLQLRVVSLSSRRDDYADIIIKCILEGFFLQILAQDSLGFLFMRPKERAKDIMIHSQSHFRKNYPPAWLVYDELVLARSNYARTVSKIDPKWLFDIAPHYYEPKEFIADYLVTCFAMSLS